MDNKKIGLVLISLVIILGLVFSFFVYKLNNEIKSKILPTDNGECLHEGEFCPYEELNELNLPIVLGYLFLSLLLLLGIYLIYSSKKMDELKEDIEMDKKQKEKDSKFNLIMSTLNESEKKVMTAVREQDGIQQSTLRIRTDFSKAKLSAILTDLEKRNLIKKVEKGKKNLIFLKRDF